MDKKIEFIEAESNSTKLTLASDRVTFKISNKYFKLFPSNIWEDVCKQCCEIPVSVTHRGTVFFNSFGFHGVIKTERDNSWISISYYSIPNKVTWRFLQDDK